MNEPNFHPSAIITKENYRQFEGCHFCGGIRTSPHSSICLGCMLEQAGAPVPRLALGTRTLLGSQWRASTTQLARFQEEYGITADDNEIFTDHIYKVREHVLNELHAAEPVVRERLKRWEREDQRTSRTNRQVNRLLRLDDQKTRMAELHGPSCFYCNTPLDTVPVFDMVIQTGMCHNLHGRMGSFLRAQCYLGNAVPACWDCNHLKGINEGKAGKTLGYIGDGRYRISPAQVTGAPIVGNGCLPSYLWEPCRGEKNRFVLGKDIPLYAAVLSKVGMLRITQTCRCHTERMWMLYDAAARQIEISCDNCYRINIAPFSKVPCLLRPSNIPAPHIWIDRPRPRSLRHNRNDWN